SRHASDCVFAGPRKAEQEQRLLDAALLVDRSEVAAFEASVRKAQQEAEAGGFRLTVAGPLPPYSFVAAAQQPELAA
ncbi:MAG: GvpL/GvpF family gas vesicle protein, partial [Beijerinckiaceae bacterium]